MSKTIRMERSAELLRNINTYSGNDLVKQIEYGSGIFVTHTYEYKYASVNIPSSAKGKVEKQQWAIRNGDYFYIFGGSGNGFTPV